MTFAEMRDRLLSLRKEECDRGVPSFLGIPDRWYDSARWRCENNHVSRIFLDKECGGDCCIACGERVMLTFPEDEDGKPLPSVKT